MYRRPNGQYTKNAELCFSEWNKLAEPFEALGFTIIGFDPGIRMCGPKSKNLTDLSTEAAMILADALNKSKGI